MPTRNARWSTTTALLRAETARRNRQMTSPGSGFFAFVRAHFALSRPPTIRMPGNEMPSRAFTAAWAGQVVVAFPAHQCGADETGDETDPEANQREKHALAVQLACPAGRLRSRGNGISRVLARLFLHGSRHSMARLLVRRRMRAGCAMGESMDQRATPFAAHARALRLMGPFSGARRVSRRLRIRSRKSFVTDAMYAGAGPVRPRNGFQ
jgi:hypothetical protein